MSKKLGAIALILSVFVGACSSTTNIRSTDPEAKIYIDGEYRGKGDVFYSDTKVLGSSTSIRLEKPGCEPRSFIMVRNEEFDAGACAGGVFLLVPFLWVQKYKGEHNYEYVCEKAPKRN
jgi:hypothetical protein